MRWYALIVLVVLSAAGCSDPLATTDEKAPDGGSIPPELAMALGTAAREQSQGLNAASVKVHRAYEYGGYTWIESTEATKVIAVDVEFRDYGQGLDLDDVDIMDGESNENYGSNPQIANLTLDGNLASDVNDASWPDDLGPLRVLLIYPLPKESKTIKLGYWGHELTSESVPISGDGPSLPTPKSDR